MGRRRRLRWGDVRDLMAIAKETEYLTRFAKHIDKAEDELNHAWRVGLIQTQPEASIESYLAIKSDLISLVGKVRDVINENAKYLEKLNYKERMRKGGKNEGEK